MQTLLEGNKIASDLTPYQMFRFSVGSEVTRKYYERRIRRLFDFIKFGIGKDIELSCNEFAEIARSDTNWAMNKVISFLQFQKERTEKGEIASATLVTSLRPLSYFVRCPILLSPGRKLPEVFRVGISLRTTGHPTSMK